MARGRLSPRRGRWAARAAQRGVSLIGLMVGTTISLIVLLGLMALYKTTVQVAVEAGRDAKHDGQLATGLMSAQMLLQGAGFRIADAAYGTHLAVLADTLLADEGGTLSGTAVALPGGGTAEGHAIVWVTNDPDGQLALAQCGLLRPARAGAGLSHATAPCPDGRADGWASLDWSPPRVLVEAEAVAILVTEQACRPFGIEEGPGGLQVELQTRHAQGALAGSACLANFLQSSPATPAGT